MFENIINQIKSFFMGSDAVTGAINMVKDKVESMGVPLDSTNELVSKAKEMLADGKISKEEVIAKVEALAMEKGLSPEMVSKVLGFLK